MAVNELVPVAVADGTAGPTGAVPGGGGGGLCAPGLGAAPTDPGGGGGGLFPKLVGVAGLDATFEPVGVPQEAQNFALSVNAPPQLRQNLAMWVLLELIFSSHSRVSF